MTKKQKRQEAHRDHKEELIKQKVEEMVFAKYSIDFEKAKQEVLREMLYPKLCCSFINALNNNDKPAYQKYLREMKLRVEVDFFHNRLKKENDPTQLERSCKHCGETFYVKRESERKVHCSRECGNYARYQKIREAEGQ
jgi:hypothetical protein